MWHFKCSTSQKKGRRNNLSMVEHSKKILNMFSSIAFQHGCYKMTLVWATLIIYLGVLDDTSTHCLQKVSIGKFEGINEQRNSFFYFYFIFSQPVIYTIFHDPFYNIQTELDTWVRIRSNIWHLYYDVPWEVHSFPWMLTSDKAHQISSMIWNHLTWQLYHSTDDD